MAKKKASDFRYNTGETKVPWAAVGENYNAEDLMAIVKFMMKGDGEDYDAAVKAVEEAVYALDKVSEPPAKLSLDAEVAKAEEMCDEYLNTEGCLFVTNCTAGFEIASKYANLKPGDEVIVPAITFAATMAYPLSIGCKIVFADVDPKTINMDPADVAKKITDKTKMIVPVHIGGYPVDMDPIMELAKKHDIIVLEDGAHAFGGEYKGKKLGTIGHFGSFSFHEVKNMTSFGEGGILTTTIEEFRAPMKRARFLGADFSKKIKNWLYDVCSIPGKDGSSFVATNFSTTEIQGLGLQLQLSRYPEILAERARAAAYLTERLSVCDAIQPQDLGNDDIKPTFHLYSVVIDPEKAGADVQVFKKKLAEKGVTEEKNIRAVHTGEMLPVCEDSCMEFFFRPMEGDLRYFNLEINPNGRMYIGFGPNMPLLVRLAIQEEDTQLKKQYHYTDYGWEVFYTFPVSVIQVFFPGYELKSGMKIYANSYKCGDECVIPHFISWNYVDVPEPSFHQPEHYGLMILE